MSTANTRPDDVVAFRGLPHHPSAAITPCGAGRQRVHGNAQRRECHVRSDATTGGLTYRADFVDEAAEQRLLTFVSSLTLEPVTMRGNTSRRTVRHFGLRYDYGSRTLREGDPIPGELAPLMRRTEEFAALREGGLVKAIIHRYPRGASLGWHQDAPVYDVIAGVSLRAACTIQFRTQAADERR
jgi:DNA oxidative demethylase